MCIRDSTTAAKEAGVEVDKNKLVAELCRYASHRCDERLIRLWVNRSGEAIDVYKRQLFTFVVCFAMRRHVRHISMVESMKAP